MFTFNLSKNYYCGIGIRRVPNRLFVSIRRSGSKESVKTFALNGTEVATAAMKDKWEFTHEYGGKAKTLSSDGTTVRFGKTKICSTETFKMLCRIAIAEFMRPNQRPRVVVDETPDEPDDIEEDGEENEQPF